MSECIFDSKILKIPKTCSIKQRFAKQVNTGEDNECWNWNGNIDKWGYGQFSYNNEKFKCHRVSYYLFKDNIPSGLIIMHKCDNPACVNPTHLNPGTFKDNTIDAIKKGRLKNPPHVISRKGELNYPAKLKNEQVRVIKQRIKSGEKLSVIAKDYQVSSASISSIKSGRSWGHLI